MNHPLRTLLITNDDSEASWISTWLVTTPGLDNNIQLVRDVAQAIAQLTVAAAPTAGDTPPEHEAVVVCAHQDSPSCLVLLEHLARNSPWLPVVVIANACSDTFAATVFRSGACVDYCTSQQLRLKPQLLQEMLMHLHTGSSMSDRCPFGDMAGYGTNRCMHLQTQLGRMRSQLEELEQIVAGIATHSVDTLLLRDAEGNIVPFVREGADVIYRLQLEALNVGVLLTDEDGLILAVNPIAAAWIGRTQTALLGQMLFQCNLHLVESPPASTSADLATPTYHMPLPGTGPDRIGQLSCLGPLPLHTTVAKFWLLTDVTDELRLRQRDHFLATLLTQVQEGVIVCTLDGMITYWNVQADQLLGWPGQTLVGQRLPTLQNFPSYYAAPLQLLQRALNQVRQNNLFRSEWQRQNPTAAVEAEPEKQTPQWVELSASPLRDSYGQIDGMLAVIHDISDRKMIEANIQSLYQQTRVAYTRLQVATEELIRVERLRALGQMASGVAHDFNNILTPILGYAELALNSNNLPSDVREDLDKIAAAARDASTIVTRLRYFYRPQTSTDTHQSVDLPTIVHQAIDLTRPRWRDIPQAQGVQIEVVLDLDAVPPLLGDATELRELLINLIFNAIDATPGGGTIRISTKHHLDAVVLSVSDTGLGMTSDVRNHLFEPFFTTKGEQGSGLGLSICQGIAEHHNATIEIASTPGAGTTVTVRFPTTHIVHTEAPEPLLGKLPVLNILYVDDDRDVRAVVTKMLESLGQYVECATSGAEAMNLLHILRFDVLISDLGMPGMSGTEVLDAARSIDPALTTVLLTGWGHFIDPQQSTTADFVISKPVRMDDLRQVLLAAVHQNQTAAPPQSLTDVMPHL